MFAVNFASRYSSRLLLIGGVITLCSLKLAASEPAGAPSLALSMEPYGTEIAPYEPFYFTAVLQNVSDKPIRFDGVVLGDLQILDAYEDGPFTQRVIASKAGADAAGEWKLAPGKAQSSAELLFHYWSRLPDDEIGRPVFIFPQPGAYKVQARLPRNRALLESPVIQVTVRKPTHFDLQAAKLLRANARAVRMIQGYDQSEGGAETLAEIAERFSKSALADHAHYALGQYYAVRAGTWFPHVDQDKTGRALKHYSAVSERVPKLKARAVYAQAAFACSLAQRSANMDFFDIQRALTKYAKIAETLALEGPTVEMLQKKLRSAEILYVDDKRLDQTITYEYQKVTPLTKIFDDISQQSHVPLQLDASMRAMEMATVTKAVKTLRVFLAEWSNTGEGKLYWQRSGNGYILVKNPSAPKALAPENAKPSEELKPTKECAGYHQG